MEFEEIVENINEGLGTTSLSSRTIEEYMRLNLPEEGTEPDAAYFEKHVNVLTSLGGQYNHDLSEAVKKFRNEQNKKPLVKKPLVKKPEASPSLQQDEESNDAMTLMLESLAKITERLDAMDEERDARIKESRITDLKQTLMDKRKELNISYEAEWEDAVNNTDLSECDEKSGLKQVKKEFERLVKRYHGGNAVPFGTSKVTKSGATETDGEEAKSLRNAYLERLKSSLGKK